MEVENTKTAMLEERFEIEQKLKKLRKVWGNLCKLLLEIIWAKN